MAKKQYWLLKSEPDVYGLDDLEKAGVDGWDGVRNYQARNYLRAMNKGDQAFFYHSRCKVPGVAGIMRIERAAYPDLTALDPKEKYFDKRATEADPVWSMVDVAFEKRLPRLVSLTELKAEDALDGLPLIRRGNRLSVMPVEAAHFKHIVAMAKRPAPA